MKKSALFAAAAAVVCSASVLAACGGNTGTNTSGSASDKFVGHWVIKTMEAGGESLDMQALMEITGAGNDNPAGMDIQNNGSFTLNIYGGETTEGTWKDSGNDSIVLTVDGSDQNATLKDNQLVMSYGSGDSELSLYFEKEGAVSETTAAETEEQTTTVEETSAEETAGN